MKHTLLYSSVFKILQKPLFSISVSIVFLVLTLFSSQHLYYQVEFYQKYADNLSELKNIYDSYIFLTKKKTDHNSFITKKTSGCQYSGNLTFPEKGFYTALDRLYIEDNCFPSIVHIYQKTLNNLEIE